VRALIIANGDPPSAGLARELAAAAGLVVAADGGADKALAFGIAPAAVVGDFDSASAAARAALPAEAFHAAPALDATDLQKAVEFAIGEGAMDIDIICAGGGRADHALANLSMLTTFRGRARLAVHDDLFAISLVEGESAFEAEPGTVVSLVAIGGCNGITTRGLRWDLKEYSMGFGALGIHNEVATGPVWISVAGGDLLLFRGRWVERHR
jgi:thiamine pyrophosphokinase